MLEGDLSDFTLPDILRLLAFTAKSGRLHIEGERNLGRVDLLEGRVRDASADAKHVPLARRLIGLGHADSDQLVAVLKGRDSLPTDLDLARELVRSHGFDPGLAAALLREQTVDAVFDLLRWERGSFRFEQRSEAESAPPDLDLKVDDLLAEADQRLEAWPVIAQRSGAPTAVVSISRPGAGTADIDADGWALLGLVDGHRTVDDLVSLSGRGQFQARQTIGQLADVGVIVIGEAGRGGAVDRLIADHRALERAESSLQAFTPSPSPRPAAGADASTSAAPPGSMAPSEPATSTPSPVERAPVAGWENDAQSDLAPTPGSSPAPSMAPAESAPSVEPVDERADEAQGDARDDNLRMRVRSERLTTDPNVDADLVTRLIDGVEGL